MSGSKRWLSAVGAGMILIGGFAQTAAAVDRITVNVLNERIFPLSIELRDKVCGGGVLLRDRLEAGESRKIEICANNKGFGALGATFGSGCSQVKRTEFLNIKAGDSLNF